MPYTLLVDKKTTCIPSEVLDEHDNIHSLVSVVSLLGVTSWHSVLTPMATALPALFAKLSTVYNPFIYAISHPKYRQVRVQLHTVVLTCSE